MCISQTKSAATFLIAEKRKPPKKLKHALWHIRIHEGESIHHYLKTCTNYCTQEQQQHWHLNKQSNTHKRGTTGGHKVQHKHWEQQQHWHLNNIQHTGATGWSQSVQKLCKLQKKHIHESKQASRHIAVKPCSKNSQHCKQMK